MGLSFSTLCITHGIIDFLTGISILSNFEGAATFIHGKEYADLLLGSTPHDQLSIRTSETLVGILLLDIALILGIISTVKDSTFQKRFCYTALITHGLMINWRYFYASKVPALANDWKNQCVGDIIMGSSWLYYLYNMKN